MASKGNLRRPGPGGVSSDFFLPCAEFSTSAGEDVVQVMGKWPGAGTLGLLGQNVASRVLEARALSEEVLSVLKVVGFVFTEKPLQALVLRTVGTTHPWDIQVAPGGRSAQGPWSRQSRERAVPPPPAQGLCDLMHAKGHSAKTGHFTSSPLKRLHPEVGSGQECGGKSLLTHLLKPRSRGFFLGTS